METVTAEQVEQAEVERPDEVEQPAARVTASKMFRYSEYVHVGDGAIECPTAVAIAAGAREIPSCTDPEHFHAWVRLANPYQHEDIRKKALAAKARRIRELRDPESDASLVLDEQLTGEGESFIEGLIDELLARDWAEDYMNGQADVEEREPFEHIAQDREEYNRLNPEQRELPEAEQSAEYRGLVTQMDAYVAAVTEQIEAIQGPKREELRSRPAEDVVGMTRSRRVEEEGDRAFLDTYNAWTWFVGTFKVDLHHTLGRPHLPMWDEMGRKDRPAAGTMFGEAPEVIEALKLAFNELQLALQRGSSGN